MSFFKKRFNDTGLWLHKNKKLWSERPFTGLPVLWEKDYLAMAASLRKLNFNQIEQIENGCLTGITVSQPFNQLFFKADKLGDWPPLNNCKINNTSRPKRISGRKWNQIEHFIAAATANAPDKLEQWLDWCSGKGHLGRTLVLKTNNPGFCIEIDRRLCNAGASEAAKSKAALGFICADVLKKDTSEFMTMQTGVVALHACGTLNTTLIKNAAKQNCCYLAVAPCCYQRFEHEYYKPVSIAGASSPLKLTKHHLRMLSFNENIATALEKETRKREQVWRLAVDLLQREGSGIDEYLPTGSVKSTWLRGSFKDFCNHLQKRNNLVFPSDINYEKAEKNGLERYKTVKALGLVRGIFRRTIESFVFLDRILFLEEAGYKVTAGTFCPSKLTPRNLMITAKKD